MGEMSDTGGTYQFRDRIPIDVPNTLHQLLGRFRTVRDGLPELVKNAKDQYSRLQITDTAARAIVVLVNTKRRALGVLDFAGASRDQFRRWETWSDPTANARERAVDIEGGHGNGGKAFMVRGSATDSFLESCYMGRRNRMGYRNNLPDHAFKPGFAIEDGKPIENLPIDDPLPCLMSALEVLGTTYDQLPAPARRLFAERNAYTIAQVNGVLEWASVKPETVRRFVAEATQAIQIHPQAALTLESCMVWFVVDGHCISQTPLSARYPEPFPGFTTAVRIPVPQDLPDPKTGDEVAIGSGHTDSDYLLLRTSAKSLRTEDMRPLNVIRVRNARNIVGLWSVPDLCPGASSGFIYGELRLPAMEGDHVIGADRHSLNDTPLVRAVEKWTADQIRRLAERIQEATAKEHRPEDCDRVNASLRKLRDLMRRFLADRQRGTDGSGEGDRGTGDRGGDPEPRPPREHGTRIDVIEVEGGAASIALAAGCRVPLRVRAFEHTANGELLAVVEPILTPHVEPSGFVEYLPDGTVAGLAAGTATLWFSTDGATAECNRLAVEVVPCASVSVHDVPERLLLQGERLTLRISYEAAAGHRDDLLNDASVDEIGMGRISRHVVFTAGIREGTATVRVRFGGDSTSTIAVKLSIGAERVPPKRARGGQEGGEIPLILLCGTPVPGMEHYPPDQRTMPASEHYPTIIDFEPEFEHVIFINPDSRESIQARRGRGGRKGAAGIATETYHQFLATKCFEILKRLRVFQDARDESLTELQFRARFASAETECAPFIEEAYRIAASLDQGNGKTNA